MFGRTHTLFLGHFIRCYTVNKSFLDIVKNAKISAVRWKSDVLNEFSLHNAKAQCNTLANGIQLL